MKVKCIHNTGKAFRGHKMPNGYSEISQFGGLDLGDEYFVAGVVVFEGLTNYLIDEDGSPSFVPYMLFQITDPRILEVWQSSVTNSGGRDFITFGYSEFCFDAEHFDGLVNLEAKHIELFEKRILEAKLLYIPVSLELQRYKEFARLHSKGLFKSEDLKKTSSYYDWMQAVASLLKSENRLQELTVLLNDEDQGVRVWAATHLLGTCESEAIQVLDDINYRNIPILSFTAEMVLSEWKSGDLVLFPFDSD